MKVRKARISDVSEIATLNRLLMKYHENFDRYYKVNKNQRKLYSKYIRKLIRFKNSLVLVAEVDKKIVGFMYGEIKNRPPIMEGKKYGHLGDAFILREYRNGGLGGKLTKELIKWFKSKGVKFVELEVDMRNETGLNFWKRLGFKPFMVKARKKLK